VVGVWTHCRGARKKQDTMRECRDVRSRISTFASLKTTEQ
jgi:hypothetical protein